MKNVLITTNTGIYRGYLRIVNSRLFLTTETLAREGYGNHVDLLEMSISEDLILMTYYGSCKKMVRFHNITKIEVQ